MTVQHRFLSSDREKEPGFLDKVMKRLKPEPPLSTYRRPPWWERPTPRIWFIVAVCVAALFVWSIANHILHAIVQTTGDATWWGFLLFIFVMGAAILFAVWLLSIMGTIATWWESRKADSGSNRANDTAYIDRT